MVSQLILIARAEDTWWGDAIIKWESGGRDVTRAYYGIKWKGDEPSLVPLFVVMTEEERLKYEVSNVQGDLDARLHDIQKLHMKLKDRSELLAYVEKEMWELLGVCERFKHDPQGFDILYERLKEKLDQLT